MQCEKLRFYPHRILEENGKKYVFSGNFSGIFEIDDKIHAIIKQEGKRHSDAYLGVRRLMDKSEYESLIDRMEKFRFVRTPKNDEAMRALRYGKEEGGVKSVILFIVQSCNLHCSYCFASGGEYHDKGIMKLSTAKKAVDFLAENSQTNHPGISFFGGEPLLNFKLIKQLIPYIRETEKKYGKRFSMGMTTNGTLLDARRKRFLEKNGISCMISLDGNKRVQDANRYFANGNGSYDIIMKKTTDMRVKEQATCRATVTPVSLDVTGAFQHLTDLGFPRVFFDAAKNMMTSGDYEEYNRQFVKFIGGLKAMIQNGEYEKAKKSSNLMNYLYFVHNAGIRKSSCGAGQSVVAVDIRGDIYPCQRFVSEKEYRIGSVLDGGFEQSKRSAFLDSIDIEKHMQCGECWAKNLCMGDCVYENLMSTGSVHITPEHVCKHRKDVFEAVIRLYLCLPEDFKNTLDKQ